jgi:transcriptional regulator with XRE-family HTH domain
MDTHTTNSFVNCQQTFLSVAGTKYFVMETLADRVKKRMKELGWSQGELARRVGHGVKQQSIHQLLSGKVKHPHYIPALAAALGVTVDYLMTGRVGPKQASGLHKLTTEQILVLHRLEALTEEELHGVLEELFRRRSMRI